MPKIKKVELSEVQLGDLQKGYEKGKSHAFRKRCHLILLKAEGRKSREVASVIKMCEMSVNNWVRRYEKQDIEGLRTKAGRGRKPKINKGQQSTLLLEKVKASRQQLRRAKAEFEQGGGPVVSTQTLRRFLKVLTEGIRE